MALENVHPEVLNRVKSQLPEGFTILSAEAESETTAFFVVEKDGLHRKASMTKGNLLQVMANRSPEVMATEGDHLDLVIRELSDAYNLYLLSGVDYDVGGARVEFSGASQYQLSVPILTSSISLSGILIFTIKNKNAVKRSPEQLQTDLAEQRLRLALAGKVFDVKDGNLLNESRDEFTNAFAEELAKFVDFLGLGINPGYEGFKKAAIISEFNDGITALVIIKLPSGFVAAVRWR